MITEESAATEARIIELRRQRMNWRDIGPIVGLSHEGARKIYIRAVTRYPAEQLNALRAEESESLDEAMFHLRKLALTADSERNRIEAWRSFILASESKRKLYGLDAPIRREVELLDGISGNAKIYAELNAIESETLAIERARNTR